MHDFRMLFDWDHTTPSKGILATGTDLSADIFRTPTELYRWAPYGQVEENWFIFWDRDGNAYVHYDMWPKRSFARIESKTQHRPQMGARLRSG